MKLRDLKGLGPASEEMLQSIDIKTPKDLEELGAVRAFIKLKSASKMKPSLNMLYAMVGALEDKHWIDIATTEKGRLIMEIDGYHELEKILEAEGIALFKEN